MLCRQLRKTYTNPFLRLKDLLFERRFSPEQVSRVIEQGFSHINLKKWKYLEVGKDGYLRECSNQKMNGEAVVSRKGCLYLLQSNSTVSPSTVSG